MRYIIIAVASIAFLFTACKKKATMTSCYVCQNYDSAYSIPATTSTVTNWGKDSLCQQTDGTIAYFIKSHTTTDTISHPGDTFNVQHWTWACSVR